MKSQLFHIVKMELMSAKKNLLMFLIIPLIYPALIRTNGKLDDVSYLLCIAIVGLILFNGFAESDEKYKTGIMLNTLPIKRNDIINARFISLCLVYAGITLVYFLSASALHFVEPDLYGAMNLSLIPAGILLVSLINVVQIPLYYLFDLQKSRVISFIVMFGIIALISYLSTQVWLEAFIRHFTKMNLVMINVSLLISAAIIYIIACSVSKKLYQHKEF